MMEESLERSAKKCSMASWCRSRPCCRQLARCVEMIAGLMKPLRYNNGCGRREVEIFYHGLQLAPILPEDLASLRLWFKCLPPEFQNATLQTLRQQILLIPLAPDTDGSICRPTVVAKWLGAMHCAPSSAPEPEMTIFTPGFRI